MRFTYALMLLSAACGPSAGGSWTLQAPGVTVEIHGNPYSLTVRDGTGAEVLDSLGAGAGDGYGALGWTSGTTSWAQNVSPGYFTFDSTLDPWRDRWTVAEVTHIDGATLDLVLQGAQGRVHIHHALRDHALRVEAAVDGGAAPRAWSTAFASPSDEAFLGFGERYDHMDQRGLTVYTWAEEGGLGRSEATPAGPANPWPSGEVMTYYPVPFFLSSKGYGFWLDTTWRSEFNLATPDQRGDAWRAWHIGPSLAYEVYVATKTDPTPWPYQVIDRFTDATGRPMVPPTWSYGPRRRINVNAMQNGEMEIQAMRDLGLALTSADDATHFLPNGSQIGREQLLGDWVKDCTTRGAHVMAYYNPYFAQDPNSPILDDTNFGLSKNFFLRDSTGAPSIVWLISGAFLNVFTVDVTSPDATSWFTDHFQSALGLGYRGWMYDFGEYVQPDVLAANGMTGEELHNLFPVLYDRAARDWLVAHGPSDWYFFARSGGVGSQQYVPVVWGGDPDASFDQANGLPAMMRGGLNLGVSGVVNWGSDIGGYKCLSEGYAGANGELVARWIEAGAVSPDMHDEDACSDAMDTGHKASIWSSPDAQDAWRTYAKLHTRLFPYLYTYAHEAHATGAPIMRAMFLEHPELDGAAQIGDTYYFGRSLLAAPVMTRGATTRDVILPSEKYFDWQDQVLYDGGQTITVPAPLGKLPLFLRDGYLVPLLDPSIETLTQGPHPGVIGPDEVADVYDVVGLISTATGKAAFSIFDGSVLSATWSGNFSAPTLPQAADESALATCDGCWLQTQIAPGVQRVRVSGGGASVTAGGLALSAASSRRIRWDLFLVE